MFFSRRITYALSLALAFWLLCVFVASRECGSGRLAIEITGFVTFAECHSSRLDTSGPSPLTKLDFYSFPVRTGSP
jgi:hypothetical protein